MKILLFIISILNTTLALSDDTSPSRSDHIKVFNQAQSCYNSTPSGKLDRKRDCAKRALQAGRFLFEPHGVHIAALTYNYGKALKKKNNKKAIEVLGQALELYEAIYGKSSLEVINVLIDMGETRKVKSIAKKYFEKDSVEYADVLLRLSQSNTLSLKESSRHANWALEIYLKEEGVESYGTAAASFQMGKIKFAQEKYKSAIPYLIGATKNPETATFAHGWLVRVYGLTNQDDLASHHAQQLGRLRQGKGNDEYIPVFVPSPNYPQDARFQREEGFALLELTISNEGRATDIILVKESPESFGFGEEALKAAKRLLYAPKVVDGIAQQVPGVRYKYTFKMAR
ncbi:MAG: hypothetical protein CMK41_06520 [Porticoccaceae bacterium]|nr:hypothetical protein [Porticoccaceae bacterium]